MKASALQPARRARADINLPVAIILALLGLLATVYVGGPGIQSTDIDMISP
jgi:hypothetical protein